MSPQCITLAGKDRPLLFSVAAIEEIETTTGSTIVALLGTPNFDVGLKTLVSMLHAGIKHGGEGNLTRDRIRTMLDRDFESGRLTIKDVIEVVQKGLVRSSTFRSQVSAEILAEMDAAEKSASGTDRPTPSVNGETTSSPSSSSSQD